MINIMTDSQSGFDIALGLGSIAIYTFKPRLPKTLHILRLIFTKIQNYRLILVEAMAVKICILMQSSM